jgi:hypothetical protein
MKKDLTGQKFGRLTVNSLYSVRVFDAIHRENEWLCQCECGNETKVLSSHLTSGHTRSCGCLMRETSSVNIKEYKKTKRIGRGPESGLKRSFSSYKQRAKKKNVAFTLSLENFALLTSQPCYYCGAPPLNISKGRYGGQDYVYNGLDRKLPNDGYIMSNVLTCCAFCNIFRNVLLTVEETKILIEKLKEIRGSSDARAFFGLRIQ